MSNQRRKNTRYVTWRNLVLERDRPRCRRCKKKTETMEAHHIVPYSDEPGLRYVLTNGVGLCADCHKAVDQKGEPLNVALPPVLASYIQKKQERR